MRHAVVILNLTLSLEAILPLSSIVLHHRLVFMSYLSPECRFQMEYDIYQL
jgi:hypothetical protein